MKRFGYLAAVCVVVGAALLSCTSPLQPPAGAGSSRAVAQAAVGGDDNENELTGTVTGFTATTTPVGATFTLTSDGTVYFVIFTGTISPIPDGTTVEVTGTIDATTTPATITATEVEVEQENTIRLVGPAAADVSFATLPATVMVNGVSVTVNSSTKLMDMQAKGKAHKTLAGVAANDPLTVLAVLDSSTTPPTVVATKITRLKKIPNAAVIQGPASADLTLTPPTLSILGVPIDYLTIPATFEDSTGDVSAAIFLAEIVNGVTIVNARGAKGAFLSAFNSTVFIAAHIGLGED
jgi:hypothetical protein